MGSQGSLRSLGPLVRWSLGPLPPLVPWFPGPLGPLVPWSHLPQLVPWSLGPLVSLAPWSLGPLRRGQTETWKNLKHEKLETFHKRTRDMENET